MVSGKAGQFFNGRPGAQKPDPLTTFGRSDIITNIHLYIHDLTPAGDGQNTPSESGQGHRLLQVGNILSIQEHHLMQEDEVIKS